MISKIKFIYPLLILFFSLIIFSSCSTEDDSDDETTTTEDTFTETAEGVFFDAAVGGVSYSSGGQSGETDADGKFTYEVGNNVTFSIGNTTIGVAFGQAFVTPVELVENASDDTNETVQNILYFLQNLDDDGDPSNGITINENIRDTLESNSALPMDDFSSLSGSTVFTEAKSKRTNTAYNPTREEARTNFQNSILGKYTRLDIVAPSFSEDGSEAQNFKALGYTGTEFIDLTDAVQWKVIHSDLASISNTPGTKGRLNPSSSASGTI